jgi:hypothetical protein
VCDLLYFQKEFNLKEFVSEMLIAELFRGLITAEPSAQEYLMHVVLFFLDLGVSFLTFHKIAFSLEGLAG